MPVDLGLEKKSVGDPVEDEIGTVGDLTDDLLDKKITMAEIKAAVDDDGKIVEDPHLREIIEKINAIIKQNEDTRKLVRKYLASQISKEKDLKL